MKQYQNYLFDLYGTLVDVHTDEQQLQLWQKLSIWLGTEGLSCNARYLKEKYETTVSRLELHERAERGRWAEIDISRVFAAIYQENGIQATKEQLEQTAKLFRILSLEKLRLFPGAKELLCRLKAAGKNIYLLSNAQSLFTRPELRALGLETLFDGIVISSEVGLKKPDVRLYRMAMERYALDASATVMVGNDDQADCHGAAAAGLDSMYVVTEQSPVRTSALPVNCRLLPEIGKAF